MIIYDENPNREEAEKAIKNLTEYIGHVV